jgi:hypothetical protein
MATTARGRVQAGVSLRLSVVLAGDGPAGPPEQIGVFHPGGLIRIPVRA